MYVESLPGWATVPHKHLMYEAVCKEGCLHGCCVGLNKCRCEPGWTGRNCSTPVASCEGVVFGGATQGGLKVRHQCDLSLCWSSLFAVFRESTSATATTRWPPTNGLIPSCPSTGITRPTPLQRMVFLLPDLAGEVNTVQPLHRAPLQAHVCCSYCRDYFSVRWTGLLKPPQTGVYTLRVVVSAGSWAAWFDGLRHTGSSTVQWRIPLVKGQYYPFRLDYSHTSVRSPLLRLLLSPVTDCFVLPRETPLRTSSGLFLEPVVSSSGTPG